MILPPTKSERSVTELYLYPFRSSFPWSDFLDLFKVVILFGDAYKSYMTQYYPGMLSTPSNSSNVYLGEDCEPKAANLGVYSEISELETSIENIETTLNGTPKKLKLYS